MRTVCAHDELLRGGLVHVHCCLSLYMRTYFNLGAFLCLADLCRDQFSRCGVAALSGQCSSLGGSCGKSCGGC